MNFADKMNGCFYGAAFGDALGGLVEFSTVENILNNYPPNGPENLEGEIAYVTDDTQMSLALADAMLSVIQQNNKRNGNGTTFTPQRLESSIRKHFIEWSHSPDNTRAPGMTCLKACANLEQPIAWQQATIQESKGCGANMRVTPIALIPDKYFKIPSDRYAIAQYQAGFTHGHPTALVASDLTCFTMQTLLNTDAPLNPTALLATLNDYINTQKNHYHYDWLGNLWQRSYTSSAKDYIARGWQECEAILEKVKTAITKPYPSNTDPCELTGEGWVAEEAFATGLLCFLLYPEQPLNALNRAVVTRGDSDSIACLTGAFVGAYHGANVWPQDWFHKIEYHEKIEMILKAMV